MKALVAEDDDRILGFTMFGAQAGEVAATVQVAMMADLPYTRLRDAVLAHPTMAEGLGAFFSNVGQRERALRTGSTPAVTFPRRRGWTLEMSTERLDPVDEPDQTRTLRRIRATDAVVAYRQPQARRVGSGADRNFGRVGVPCDVRQRLGHKEIRGHFDGLREPAVDGDVQLDGTAERRATALSAGPSPPFDRIAGWIPRDISRSSSDTRSTR